MSKSFSRIALSVATTPLCAMVVLTGSTGSRSARAQEALFASQRDCAADVSSLCAGHGWGPIDAGTAILMAALIGAASTITVTILTGRQQPASFPAPAAPSSAARAVALGGRNLPLPDRHQLRRRSNHGGPQLEWRLSGHRPNCVPCPCRRRLFGCLDLGDWAHPCGMAKFRPHSRSSGPHSD